MDIWNPIVRVSSSKEDNCLLFISEDKAVKLNCTPLGISADQLYRIFLDEEKFDDAWQISSIKSVRSELYKRGFLIKKPPSICGSNKNFGYFCSKSLDPGAAIGRLMEARVAIVGLGGTGSVILQHLVGVKIKFYTLVDFDVVNNDNFNRQFIYAPSDIGIAKTLASRRYIKERIPEASVQIHQCRITSGEDLTEVANQVDILFCCIDTPADMLPKILYDYRKETHIPTIMGAVGIRYGECGVVNEFDDQDCETFKAYASARKYGAPIDPIPWSFGPTNTIVGTVLAKRGIEWLAGCTPISQHKEVTIVDFDAFEARILP